MTLIKVKNMVCDRCKSVLKSELEKNGFRVGHIDLGEVQFGEGSEIEMDKIRKILDRNGFELVINQNEQLIAQIRNHLIIGLQDRNLNQNLSEYLVDRVCKDYSVLSKLFSAHEGITIEKYFIGLKIEKVKELIQMGDRTFSEIAYGLGYTSSSHLARQFKSATGMSMGTYQKAREWNRKPLDQIV
ncbi:helix-turn-helix domain-containing protein [Muricauda sp. JGD-17]|uniref:Helix-turn-helix domain-containing protein n=1 Tax=Flagellimonas ochracea TaxID=2696472 RepID=A0A964WWB1_9FLAO|nr:AraC family transcriptional regulator [Allomuricauda ochracea]NAY90790.1 helix-turn-helix domain-containing protein [Allomuricauda ochracea]